MLHAHNEEALLLFELVTRVAAHVKHYETFAFDNKWADYVQLQETVIDLCYSLLKVQISIVCPRDSDKYGILSRQSTRGFLDALDEYAIIKQLDEVCNDQVTHIQGLALAAAVERVKRMEAEMEDKVRAEVTRQFQKATPYLVQSLWRSFNEALMQQDANSTPPSQQNIPDGEGSHDDAGSRNPQQRDDGAEGHTDDRAEGHSDDRAEGHNELVFTSRDLQPETHKDSPTSQVLGVS